MPAPGTTPAPDATAPAPRADLRTRWQRLPRESRDTLFLVGVIGWTVLPHFAHLPAWATALTLLVLAWRSQLALGGRPLPGRAPLIGLIVLAIGLTWWSEHTLLGKDAGVMLLVVLLALKTLEQRARRDVLVLFFLGFFLVLTQCLFSQSMPTAASMAISTWGLLTAQVLSSMPVGRPSLKRAGWIAARAALLGAPLMALLFVLFPRFGPLWGLPQDGLGHSGLSGSLRLGGVAELAADDSIALRVRFAGRPPPAQALYFRGPVLSRFDGLEWRQAGERLGPRAPGGPWRAPALRPRGTPAAYELLLEPIRLQVLPLLEATPRLPEDNAALGEHVPVLGADLVWRTDRLVAERLRVDALAWPQFELDATRPWPDRALLTQLPEGSNPRAVAWARQWMAQPHLAGAGAGTLAASLMAHIREEGFRYTLAPGDYGTQAVDEFWLDRREGFCEHFAAAFVVLMRAMDVPARIVTGYQGAEPPDADGWQIVRQSHAHAWAEYWVPGRGWQRADPTAAVAPWRIDTSRPLRPRPGFMAGALGTVSPALAEQLRRAWELMDNRWNQWVMNYSRSRQFDLLESLGVRGPGVQDLAVGLIGVISSLALAGALWAWWDRRRQDPWLRLHERLCRTLRSLGVDARPHHGPRTLAELLRARHGQASEPAAQALLALDALRHGPGGHRVPPAGWRRGFEAQARQLRRSARPPAAPG